MTSAPFTPVGRAIQSTYRRDEINRCPGCGRSHWIIGRATAECAFCATALPLADSRGRTPRVVGFGNGGGRVLRMAAA